MESHKFFGKYLCHNMEAISTRKPECKKKNGIKIFIYCRPKQIKDKWIWFYDLLCMWTMKQFKKRSQLTWFEICVLLLQSVKLTLVISCFKVFVVYVLCFMLYSLFYFITKKKIYINYPPFVVSSFNNNNNNNPKQKKKKIRD